MISPRTPPMLIIGASIAILGAALLFQYVGGLQPCILCHYQRYAYIAAIVLAVIALALAGRPGPNRALVGLCGAVFLAGAAVAAYNVGVEQGWITPSAACLGLPEADSIEALRAQLNSTSAARCDEVPWSLFGVSLAGWNIPASLVLAAGSAYAAIGLGRREQPA